MPRISNANDNCTMQNEIDDLATLEECARGTLRAIHQSIHSADNFSCPNHRINEICPQKPYSTLTETKIPIRSRAKFRSNSCSSKQPSMNRTLSANDAYMGCTRPHFFSKMERSQSSNADVQGVHYASIGKAISCPEKICCPNINKICTVTTKSSVQIDNFAKNLLQTDQIIKELKGEIQMVKHQLHHIHESQQKVNTKANNPYASTASPNSEYQNKIDKLKSENKQLKTEIQTKKTLMEKYKGDIIKAKEILSDYEKKVSLLHVQALKSSKAMKLSNEKFSQCIKEREDKIRSLQEINKKIEMSLKQKESIINDKDVENKLLKESIDTLRNTLEESSQKCSNLTEANESFIASIDMLKSQLLDSSTDIENYQQTVQTLEDKLCNLNCVCKKIVTKAKRQKENYDSIIKSNEEEQIKMIKQIDELSTKLEESDQHKKSSENLQNKCKELEERVQEYEMFSKNCKALEEEVKKEHEKLVASEESFKKDKQEMEKLIGELTTVVKENKVTLLQISEINKRQEIIIKSQSMALLTKEEQLKLMVRQSEEFKVKNESLEKQVEQLKKSLSEPCSKEDCICVSKELIKIRDALKEERDTQLIKEKIIQDQSKTILNLQAQVREKMSELNRTQSDTRYLEEEIDKINKKLIRKHEELDLEVDEKESLIEKLRILECQKNQLSEEINDFEDMLQKFKETCGDNEKQQAILWNLEQQIAEQRRTWENQRESMSKEKQMAVCAAKFATQKLLDTVVDFQRQVDAQKKAQFLLAKLLHEKDEQLRMVMSKITNINTITKDVTNSNDKKISMQELFFQRTFEQDVQSEDNTNTSMYSSCSSCSRKQECLRKRSNQYQTEKPVIQNQKPCGAPSANVRDVVDVLRKKFQHIQEEPIRDLN